MREPTAAHFTQRGLDPNASFVSSLQLYVSYGIDVDMHRADRLYDLAASPSCLWPLRKGPTLA